MLRFLSVALQRQLHRLTKTKLNIFGSAPSLGRAEYPAPAKIRCASKVAFYASFKPKFEAGTTHHLATGESCRLGLVARIFKPSNKKCFQRNLSASGSLGRNSRSVIWETCSCKRPACRLRLAEAQMFSRSRPSQRWTRCHQHIGDAGCLQKVKGIKPAVYFQSICNRIQSISCLLLDI